jgi:hypothetical protein
MAAQDLRAPPKPCGPHCKNRTGAATWSHFGIDFAAFRAKNGTKTPEKGPKIASSGYLSVNRMFLQVIHSL